MVMMFIRKHPMYRSILSNNFNQSWRNGSRLRLSIALAEDLIQSPACTLSSQPTVIPVPRDSDAYFGFHGYWQTREQTEIETYTRN